MPRVSLPPPHSALLRNESCKPCEVNCSPSASGRTTGSNWIASGVKKIVWGEESGLLARSMQFAGTSTSTLRRKAGFGFEPALGMPLEGVKTTVVVRFEVFRSTSNEPDSGTRSTLVSKSPSVSTLARMKFVNDAGFISSLKVRTTEDSVATPVAPRAGTPVTKLPSSSRTSTAAVKLGLPGTRSTTPSVAWTVQRSRVSLLAPWALRMKGPSSPWLTPPMVMV